MTPILSCALPSLMLTPGLSRAVTSRSAAALSAGEATVPVMTATWPAVVTVIAASGMASLTMRSMEVMFWLTRMFVA